MKTPVTLSRILVAALILVIGIGLAFTFGEQESQALNSLPEGRIQTVAGDAGGRELVAAVASGVPGSAPVSIYRSADNGRTWSASGQLPVAAVTNLIVAPGNNSLIYAGTDTRLFQSLDGGTTWQELSLDLAGVNLANASLTSLAVDPQHQDRLLIGTTQGLLVRENGRLSPIDSRALDGSYIAQVLVSAANPEHVFVATGAGLFSNASGDWARVASVSAPVRQITELDGTLIAATANNGLYRSLDGGQSWTNLSQALGLQPGLVLDVTAMQSDPRDAGVLYAATGYWFGTSEVHFLPGQVYVSVDSGSNWQPMTHADGSAVTLPARVLHLVPDPNAHLSVTALTENETLNLSYANVEALVAGLKSSNAQTRAWSATALGLLGDRSATGALMDHLADPDAATGLAVARALGKLGDPAVIPSLNEALQSDTDMVRMRAALALGLLKAESAVPALAQIVLNDNSVARAAAADALAEIGTPAAAQALASNLVDDEMTARRQAAMSGLEKMGDAALPALDTLVRSDPSAIVRRNATELLGWIGSAQATNSALSALQDSSADVRAEAAWALGEIGGTAARSALQETLQNDPDPAVRTAAAQAMSRSESLVVRSPAPVAVSTAAQPGLLDRLAGILAPPRGLILLFSLILAAAVLLVHPRRRAANNSLQHS